MCDDQLSSHSTAAQLNGTCHLGNRQRFETEFQTQEIDFVCFVRNELSSWKKKKRKKNIEILLFGCAKHLPIILFRLSEEELNELWPATIVFNSSEASFALTFRLPKEINEKRKNYRKWHTEKPENTLHFFCHLHWRRFFSASLPFVVGNRSLFKRDYSALFLNANGRAWQKKKSFVKMQRNEKTEWKNISKRRRFICSEMR